MGETAPVPPPARGAGGFRFLPKKLNRSLESPLGFPRLWPRDPRESRLVTVELAPGVMGLTGVLAAVLMLARTELGAVLEEGGGWEERLEAVLSAASWGWD